jgi:hypothetical protein
MERHDAGCVPPFAGIAVDKVTSQIGIAGQYFRGYISSHGLASDALTVLGVSRDLLGQEILDRRPARAVAMRKEANHHRECPATISASSRSKAINNV